MDGKRHHDGEVVAATRKRARPAAVVSDAGDGGERRDADRSTKRASSASAEGRSQASAASTSVAAKEAATKLAPRSSPLTSPAPNPPRAGSKVVVVLQRASLEAVKTKMVRGAHREHRTTGSHAASGVQGFELLNCDDHVGLLKKAKRDPASARPDITHQLMLALLDSPLNKAGYLQVYIETTANVLIEVSPSVRIPRTFKRFAGLMVQLLYKLRVRAADSAETLLKVIRNPVTAHLPVGAPIVGLEAGGPIMDAFDLPHELARGRPRDAAGAVDGTVVFVIGAMSHGDISADYIQRTVSVSSYPLSAACAVSKLLNAYEHAWGVL